MTEEGNYQEESTGRRTGKNVLYLERSLAEAAEHRGMDEAELRDRLADAHATLREHRGERPRPGLDDKVLTDWNGLIVAALARAARVFEAPAYETAATEAATFLMETLRDEEGRLLHRYRDGDAAIRAHLDDYAFLTWGLTELYETTFDPQWLSAAVGLMETSLDRFWDAEQGGFFLTTDDGEALIVRPKEGSDGALPSGNSVQLMNLLRLARMTGRTEWEEQADALAQWAGTQARSRPTGMTALLSGVSFAHADASEVVVAGAMPDEETQTLIAAVRSVYSPFSVVLQRPPGEAPSIVDLAPFTDAQTPINGAAAAYVCRNFRCEAPTTDPDALRSQLKGESTA
jgi:uncharacterized protein YyaL (SSP411 family)